MRALRAGALFRGVAEAVRARPDRAALAGHEHFRQGWDPGARSQIRGAVFSGDKETLGVRREIPGLGEIPPSTLMEEVSGTLPLPRPT